MTFNKKIGYPVYPLDSYNDGIRNVSKNILEFDRNKYITIDACKKFFESIIDQLDEEDENYTLDQMSR